MITTFPLDESSSQGLLVKFNSAGYRDIYEIQNVTVAVDNAVDSQDNQTEAPLIPIESQTSPFEDDITELEVEKESSSDPDACYDTNRGEVNEDGDDCSFYEAFTVFRCGSYDSGNFDSEAMCCACGGG